MRRHMTGAAFSFIPVYWCESQAPLILRIPELVDSINIQATGYIHFLRFRRSYKLILSGQTCRSISRNPKEAQAWG